MIYSYASDLERGIHIQNFYDDKTDKELNYLTSVLLQIKPFSDVAELLERSLGFQRLYDYL